MIKSFLNKDVELSVYGSAPGLGGSQTSLFRGRILEVGDEFIKFNNKRRPAQIGIVVIAIKYIITIREL